MHDQTSRRLVLGGLYGLGIFALAGSGARSAAAARASGAGLIDVHRHILSPRLRAAGEPQGLATAPLVAGATADRMLADMDGAGVTRSILSQMTPPAFFTVPPAENIAIARDANETMARLAADHPGRFGFFAELPMPDVDASLAELAHALDTLHADGVQLHTSYGGKWLGDPDFAPLYAELNRRKAVVYTHPLEAACCKPNVPELAATVIEFGADTARSIARFIFSGASTRYPDLRVIFSHGGGVLTGIVGRFAYQATLPQFKDRLPQGLDHELQRHYYDTAQAFHPATLRGLGTAVPLSQILFGTDYPYRTAAETWQGVQAAQAFSWRELRAIAAGNAERLLARR
jgi:6-methylsalicylate decarboxylase